MIFQDLYRDVTTANCTGAAFSEAVDIDGEGLRSALDVSGGTATDAQPVDGRARLRSALSVTGGTVAGVLSLGDERDQWRIRVRPSGNGLVTLSLASSGACGSASAICTEDGRALSARIATTIAGPPGLSVADAEVQEAANARLAFAITLARAASDTVTVQATTSDGTAGAGATVRGLSAPTDFLPGLADLCPVSRDS